MTVQQCGAREPGGTPTALQGLREQCRASRASTSPWHLPCGCLKGFGLVCNKNGDRHAVNQHFYWSSLDKSVCAQMEDGLAPTKANIWTCSLPAHISRRIFNSLEEMYCFNMTCLGKPFQRDAKC